MQRSFSFYEILYFFQNFHQFEIIFFNNKNNNGKFNKLILSIINISRNLIINTPKAKLTFVFELKLKKKIIIRRNKNIYNKGNLSIQIYLLQDFGQVKPK